MEEEPRKKAQQGSDTENQEEKNAPQWIKELFSQTWDPELLLSGISIYALIQLPELLDLGFLYLKQWHIAGTKPLYLLLVLASRALLYTFIFHLILRGVWIGVVGLNSVFRKGIQFDKLRYSDFFNNKLKRNTPNLDQLTLKLDDLCSLLFSFSFLFILLLFSTCLWYMLTFFLILTFEEAPTIISQVLIIIYLASSAIYFLDFLTLGLFKKNEIISKIYYPIYWFFSKITLSFLYRPVYYAFISNISKGKWIVSFFAYFSIVSMISYTEIATKFQWPSLWGGDKKQQKELFNSNISAMEYLQDCKYYDDCKKGESPISIQSDIIKANYIRVKINTEDIGYDKLGETINHHTYIERICPESSKLKTESNADEKSKSKIAINCLAAYYRLYINDSLYNNLHFLYAEEGITTYIAIDHLPIGLNTLELRLNRAETDWNHFIAFIIDRPKVKSEQGL